MERKNFDKVFQIIIFVGFVMMALMFAFYIVHFIDYMLDSDMSSELVLAELLSQKHRIVSTDWYYSTELRLLNTQLIFTPLFWILNDWHMIRVVGTLLQSGILVVLYLYLSKKAELNTSPVFAALLLCPLSDVYFKIVLGGVYYIPHISITFVSLGMILAVWKNSLQDRKTQLCFLALQVISLLAGMGGFRQVMILYMPLLAAAVIFASHTYKREADWKKLLFVTGTVSLLGIAGCVINRVFLAKKFVFADIPLQVTGFSLSRLEINVNGWLTVLGMKTGELLAGETLIYNASFAVIFCLTVFSVYFILKHPERYKKEQVFLTLVFTSGVAILLVFYLFVEFSGSANYLLPISILFIPVIAAFLQGLDSKWIMKTIQTVLMLACIGVAVLYYRNHTEDKTWEYREITNVLMEKNVTEGCATFWNANVLTELSDGKIEVWSFKGEEDGGLDLCNISEWLQKKEHSVERPEGSTFLLLNVAECMWMEFGKAEYQPYIAYQSENYVLYIFDSYEEMMDIYLKN